MTRRLIGKRAMTPAEKQQRYRDLRKPKIDPVQTAEAQCP